MKQRVAHRSAGLGRGNRQQIAEFHVTVKPDYDRIVAALRKFKFPTLWTLDDLVAIVDWRRDPTQADRVHLSRALRRAGVEPLRGTKIWLTDLVTVQRIRTTVWCINGKAPDFKTAGQIRYEYYRQHHIRLKLEASLGTSRNRLEASKTALLS